MHSIRVHVRLATARCDQVSGQRMGKSDAHLARFGNLGLMAYPRKLETTLMAHSDAAVHASPRASTPKPLDLSDCQSLKHYIRQEPSRPMRTVAGPTTSDVVVYPLHRSRIVAGTCGLKEALAPLQHFDYSLPTRFLGSSLRQHAPCNARPWLLTSNDMARSHIVPHRACIMDGGHDERCPPLIDILVFQQLSHDEKPPSDILDHGSILIKSTPLRLWLLTQE